MKLDLMNKISELYTMGYYDKPSKFVIAWFYNDDIDKPDIVAYLLPSMEWDLREVIEETSSLQEDKEVIEIKHLRLGLHKKGSDIDNIIRKSLNIVVERNEEDGHKSSSITTMGKILNDNSYDCVRD